MSVRPSAPPRSPSPHPRDPAAFRWGHRLLLHTELADFSVRRFHCGRPGSRAILERHARAFLDGFNTAVTSTATTTHARLARLDPTERGFAYEGAGMAYALLDTALAGRGRRTRALLVGPGHAHTHLVHVGAGWALARLRHPGARHLLGLDPLLQWLTLDGHGFAHGFFGGHAAVARYARGRAPHRRGAVRHQGLGRSLWFLESADPDRIARTVGGFPPDRRGHLWSGVGLAACYAGGAADEELDRLRAHAAPYGADLAQGAAFAAEARRHAGHVPEHTRRAVPRLTGADVDTAADWTVAARGELLGDGSIDDYLLWRALIARRALAAMP